ncbi:MAG: hypothetical protein ABIQ10_05115 [Gemmatimonadaceae bacterium]
MSDAAPRMRASRAVTSALLLVLSTVLALLLSVAATFIRLGVQDVFLGRLQRIVLPIVFAAVFAFIAVRGDLRSLTSAGLLTSRWRVHATEAALIYASLAWVAFQFSRCPCYPDLVIVGGAALMVLIGTLLGALIATSTFRR